MSSRRKTTTQKKRQPRSHAPEEAPPRVSVGNRSSTVYAVLGLLVVCLFAGALRLHRLDAESLWMDEARQVSFYDLPLKHLVLEACGQGQPPLDYLIGGGLARLGLAGSDWWVRFPAAIFGIGGVFLLGWLVMRIAGPIAGITAAFLLALSPLHVAMSQEARPYSIFFFFALAAILAYARAYRRNTLGAWLLFGGTFLGMLMSRAVAPHVITLGLIVFACFHAMAEHRSPDQSVRANGKRSFWATVTTIAISYAIYNPLLGILYAKMNTTGIFATAETGSSLSRAAAMMAGVFRALTGAEGAGLSMGVENNPLFISVIFALVVIGMFALLRHLRRDGNSMAKLLLVTLVAFPFVFALIYTRLTTFPAKAQYSLLFAVPLFATVAIAANALRERLHRRNPAVGWFTFAIIVLCVGLPMGRASVSALYQQDRVNWRGAFTFLRQHVSQGDAVATVLPHWSIAGKGTSFIGKDRYFGPGETILSIDLDTPAKALEHWRWAANENRVWILCNKAPRGEELLPAPLRPVRGICIHDFGSLFVLEVSGDSPAADRLINGLAFLEEEASGARGLAATNLYRAKFHIANGHISSANACIVAADRHCITETQRMELISYLALEQMDTQVTQIPPMD